METMRELVERLQKTCDLCPESNPHLAHRECEACNAQCCNAHIEKCSRCYMWICEGCADEHEKTCKYIHDPACNDYDPPNGGVNL